MNRQEAWVRFAAAVLGDNRVGEKEAGDTADEMLRQMDARFPPSDPSQPTTCGKRFAPGLGDSAICVDCGARANEHPR